MIEPTIHGLSNEAYHHEEPYSEYLSSSQLKRYAISPKAAKFALDNPTEDKSDALRFGSLFHDLMASYAAHHDDEFAAIRQWEQGMAIFEPPVNKSTNKPYGVTSNPHKEAYAAFLQANEGRLIVSRDEADLAYNMANSLLRGCGATSEQVRKLLKWGKPEVSFFYEFTEKDENGEDVTIRLKVRPDLLTDYKIIDWKTVSTDDLSEENINRIILKYGYHISAAMYQWVVWKVTGIWRDFYLVIISKTPPYDCIMVNMCAVLQDIYGEYHYGYGYCANRDGIVIPGCGAMEFKKLLDLHIKCTKENHWAGAEQAIPDNNGVRILEIQPPRYYSNKFLELE